MESTPDGAAFLIQARDPAQAGWTEAGRSNLLHQSWCMHSVSLLLLRLFGKLTPPDMLCTLEHQVLKEMCKPGAAFKLILCPDMVHNIDNHVRCGVVLMQYHMQAVVKRVLRELNSLAGCAGKHHQREQQRKDQEFKVGFMF